MLIKDQIDIDAPPDQVWPFLIDPVLQAAWNPKIISIDRPHDGPVRPGDTYVMHARLSDKQSTSRVEVVDVITPQKLVYQHHMTEAGSGFVVTETYTLSEKGRGTRVRHTIDLSQTPIPLLLRPVIWLVMKFGKPVGEPQLGGLKQMIESELA